MVKPFAINAGSQVVGTMFLRFALRTASGEIFNNRPTSAFDLKCLNKESMKTSVISPTAIITNGFQLIKSKLTIKVADMTENNVDMPVIEFSIRLNKVLNQMEWPIRGRAPMLKRELEKHGVVVSAPACTKWLGGKGRPEPEKLSVICKITGKTMDYFLAGLESTVREINQEYSVEVSNQTRTVPHVSWSTAKALLTGKAVPIKQLYEKIVTSQNPVSEGAFAVTYDSDEMTSQNGFKMYPNGATMIFDRTNHAVPSTKVIALINDDIVFRELSVDAGEMILRPWNGQYRTIIVDDNVKIKAVLKEYFVVEGDSNRT